VRPGPNNALPTGYTYTGQLDSGLGLMYYGARFYDGALGRFISPDTIVPEPGNPQALNRYSYVLNNPLRYTDPTGMFSEDEIMGYLGVSTWDDVLAMFGEGGVMAGAWGFLEVLRQAELGDPISMWYDISGGMTSIASVTGSFYEQDGQLMFGGQIGADANPLFLPAVVFGQMSMHGRASAWSVNNGAMHFILNKQYSHLVFRPNQVDWYDAGVDVFGIVGDVALVAAPGPGTVVWLASEFAELTSVGKQWDQLETGNPSDVLLDYGVIVAQDAKLLPQWGSAANIASLAVNLGQGFTITP
jgi:RHS repeat-associated protein